MTAQPPGSEYRLPLPRWRTVERSLADLESAAGLTPPTHKFRSLDEASQAFRAYPGPFTAGDLLGQARMSNQTHEDLPAAESMVMNLKDDLRRLESSKRHDALPVVIDRDESFDAWRTRVKRCRIVLRQEPRNALRWTDLALAHVTLGNIEAAERSLLIAHGLSPDNRHVLRALARFSTISGEERRARRLIVASNATQDPWVVAAELGLSLSLGGGSQLSKVARNMAQRRSMPPRQLSELASALGTQELLSGTRKVATRLLRQSLVAPTENALAQAVWSRQQGSGIRESEVKLRLDGGFEAESRRLVEMGCYDEALRPAQAWLNDQPFAQEPAVHLSWLAVMGADQPQIAIDAAKRGLVTNPKSWILQNNLTVALVLAGQISDAVVQLKGIDEKSIDYGHAGTLRATEGLILFRTGLFEEGRAKYEAAARGYSRQGDRPRSTIALLSLAREEVRAATGHAEIAVSRAVAQSERENDPLIARLRDQVVSLASGRPSR